MPMATSSTFKSFLEIRLESAPFFKTRSRRERDPQAHPDIPSSGGKRGDVCS